MQDSVMDIPRFLSASYDKLLNCFGPQHWWPGGSPFEVAVGAVLTQNTNWGNVEKAIASLVREDALSASALHDLSDGELAFLIRPAGYFNVKARRLKAFIAFLMEHFQGEIERMGGEETSVLRDRLLSVHGIGQETADSILLYALERPVFVIDAYTKRILSRHHLTDPRASYGQYQDLFHRNLPAETPLYNEYHALIVRTGKTYCRPSPQCGRCPLF